MYSYCLYTMLWTVDSGNTTHEDCLELARIQMPPSTLFGMFVAAKLFLALRTAELYANWMFESHLDVFFCNVHFYIRDGPRGCESKNMLIELFVLHYRGLLSPAIVARLKEKTDGQS